MYCFWSGEKTFGAIPGVIETAPGFQDGREVVRVVYNPAQVTKAELEKQLREKSAQYRAGRIVQGHPRWMILLLSCCGVMPGRSGCRPRCTGKQPAATACDAWPSVRNNVLSEKRLALANCSGT